MVGGYVVGVRKESRIIDSEITSSYSSLYLSNKLPYDDPYDDLLNFEKSVSNNIAHNLAAEWTLNDSDSKNPNDKKDGNSRSSLATVAREERKKPWVHWDDFMESEFGDMDRELGEDEEWMYAVRDAVEMKRGMAIWSKKTPKEIKAELKKSLTSKGINIPEKFYRVIVSVFLEKTHSMKEMRKENELHVIEFRKWMIEQKKRLKKDPLPVVKVDASKKWLGEHPELGLKRRGIYHKPPEVVMDELRDPLAHVQFEFSSDGNNRKSAKTRSSMSDYTGTSYGNNVNNISSNMDGSKSSSISQNKVTTVSMINWEVPASELPDQMTCDPTPEAALTESNKELFKIDEVDILVATEGDYYVVM